MSNKRMGVLSIPFNRILSLSLLPAEVEANVEASEGRAHHRLQER